jgi:hypothetical protein
MTLLDHLAKVPSSSLEDVNFVAFVEATSIIIDPDAVEEFLSCGLRPLGEKFGFRVETKESPMSKVMLLMPQVTATIEAQESGAAFEAHIVNATNLLVGNYNVAEHNTY